MATHSLTLTADSPGSVRYDNSKHYYSYTFGSISALKQLNKVCLLQTIKLRMKLGSEISDSPPVRYTIYCGSQSYSGTFALEKGHSQEVSASFTVGLSGANYFGGTMTNNAYRIEYEVDKSIMTWFTYYIVETALDLTYVIRNKVNFTNTNKQDSEEIYAEDVVPASPKNSDGTIGVSPPTGYQFQAWESSLDSQPYADDNLPPCTGQDIVYTAVYEPITYTFNLLALDDKGHDWSDNIFGTSKTVTCQIGGKVNPEVSLSDFKPSNTQTFEFVDWQIASQHYNGSLSDGQSRFNKVLTEGRIQQWFVNGATSATLTASYLQVYDLNLQFSSSAASDGLHRVNVSDGSTTTIFDVSSIAATGGATVRLRSSTGSIFIYLCNGQTYNHADDDYCLYNITATGMTYRGYNTTDNPRPTHNGQAAGVFLNYGIQLTSSCPTLTLNVHQCYYGITLTYTEQIDDAYVVKVYQNGQTLVPSNALQRLWRYYSYTVDATTDATKDTKYNATLKDASDNPISGNKAILTSLTQNMTYLVDVTDVRCTIYKQYIIDGTEGDLQSVQVTRGTSYRFTATASGGKVIQTAVIYAGDVLQQEANSTQRLIYTTGGVSRLSHTVGVVTDDMLMTVYLTSSPSAYLYYDASDAAHCRILILDQNGDYNTAQSRSSIQVTDAPDIYGIFVDVGYEASEVTYEWVWIDDNGDEHEIPNTAGTLNLPTIESADATQTIPAPLNNAIATALNQYASSGGLIVCRLHAVCNYNKLFINDMHNSAYRLRQPIRIVVSTPGLSDITHQQVQSVFIQTATHPAPILLFGPASEEVEPEPPEEETKYKVLSLESQDMLNGSNTHVYAVWTEDSGVCTPISFSTDFDTNWYDVHLDSITASMNASNQRVYTIIIYDETYGRDSYSFVCQQDNDGEWVYNNQSYNCDGQLLWGYGPATITTVYEDPTT